MSTTYECDSQKIPAQAIKLSELFLVVFSAISVISRIHLHRIHIMKIG